MNSFSDLLIRIKNAYLAGHKSLEVIYTRQGERLAEILIANKLVDRVEVLGKDVKKTLKINLIYYKKKPAITDVKIISKPGVRIYTKAKRISKVLGGTGISIVSTPQGLMTGTEAKKKNLGGEMLGEVW